MKNENSFFLNLIKYTTVLAVIAALSGAVLFFVHEKTKSRISENRKQQTDRAIREVLPRAETIEPVGEGSGKPLYYIGKKDGSVCGYACEGSARGYSSEISLIVGVAPDFNIKGVSVKSSQETPGLGERIKEKKRTVTITDQLLTDKTEKENLRPWFLKQFNGKTLEQVRLSRGNTGDIHAITGATISSRAVAEAVRRAVETLKKEVNSSRTP